MISAIVLAAGRSNRMGQPKMIMPWGDTTVLGKVLETLMSAGINHLLVVTGGAREQVEDLCARYALHTVHNADYAKGEMLSSLQSGLRALIASLSQKVEQPGGKDTRPAAALVCLGDQPQIQAGTVQSVCEAYQRRGSNLVVPSYQMRRGHPWLAARPLWDELLEMKSPQSPREFLNAHRREIEYVLVDNASVIEDLDTPEDYLRHRPSAT
jgi:molybdenum cofactor cytidylyltransferase